MVWCDKNVNVLEWGRKKSLFHTSVLLTVGFTAISPISTSEHEQKWRDYEAIMRLKPKIQCAPLNAKRQTKNT